MIKLLSLLQLSDPAFPIGGFSHTAGLETYVQAAIVKDKVTAVEFITAQLSQNILYTDAAFVSLAYDAVQENNLPLILELDEECTAVKMPKEMRQASQKLGLRLLKLFAEACEDTLVGDYRKAVVALEAGGHYSIAFGLMGYALSVPKRELLTGFFYNMAAGMVTNCVKLVPPGPARWTTDIVFNTSID